MAKRCVPAPFLTKTYSLVDDGSSDEVISWKEDGTTFVVWKTAEFSKDLLPKYFKHNNFSSFVRQLNTYGFRKISQDKWEFGNENFKRGQEELLADIRRRRTSPPQLVSCAKLEAVDKMMTSPTNSGELVSSSTTCCLEPMPMETNCEIANNLSDENKKLRKDNQMLSSELAETKKKCDEMISFLTRCMKLAPDQICRIINFCKPQAQPEAGRGGGSGNYYSDHNDDENEECVKLFGVVVKKKKKRCRFANMGFSGPTKKGDDVTPGNSNVL